MPLNSAQFEALFTNAFGEGPAAFGISIDANTDTDTAVGRKGDHTVELHIVQDRAIEWRVDGAAFLAWKQYEKKDRTRDANGAALRSKLA
jgi:hypothetical protein